MTRGSGGTVTCNRDCGGASAKRKRSERACTSMPPTRIYVRLNGYERPFKMIDIDLPQPYGRCVRARRPTYGRCVSKGAAPYGRQTRILT